MMDWRTLEAARVKQREALGLPVSRPGWTCEHHRTAEDSPQKMHRLTANQRMWGRQSIYRKRSSQPVTAA